LLKAALLAGISATVVVAAAVAVPAGTPTSFSISGHVDGLFPGAELALPVRIRNPYRRRIRVVSVRASVGPSGRPCPMRNVQVSSFRGSLVVAAHRSRWISLRVRMLRSAASACQGEVFPLRFIGRAVRP
jgi:hypothetical protein